MIREAMPTFLDKDLVMEVKYQKVTEKAKGYESEKGEFIKGKAGPRHFER
jgi:hypothetical protein